MSDKFQQILDQHIQKAQPLLEEYLRLESVAAQNRGIPETAAWVEKQLQETGFETRQIVTDGSPLKKRRTTGSATASSANAARSSDQVIVAQLS